MKNSDFIIKRDEWLQDVRDQCHEFAQEIDLDFYIFQTQVNEYNPDLLIIGINPGGDNKYSDWFKKKENVGVQIRPIISLSQGVNTLVEKPNWEIEEKERGADKMRAAFSRVFTAESGLKPILENAVMMNIIYFNTKSEADLNLLPKEVKEFCRLKTLEFISILNPKNILFLTSESKLKKYGVKNIENISDSVKKGKFNEFDVFCIPHYGSYAHYSYERGPKMAKTLVESFKK